MSSQKIFSNSIIYIFLGFLTPAINFILLPIYTSYLETEDYALITQSSIIQSVFTTIIGLGLNAAYTRFYYDSYNDLNKKEELYSTAILFYLFSGLCVVLFLSFFGQILLDIGFSNNVFTFWDYGIYSVGTAFLINLQLLSLNYYRVQEKAKSFAVLAILFFLSVAISIYIGVVFLDLKAKGSIIGRFIGTCIPIVIYLIWFYRNKKVSYSFIMNKRMLIYSLPLVPYLLLNVFLDQVDKYAIERYFDLHILGLYGFGFLIASVNEIFINSLNSAISPQIFKNLSLENINNIEKVKKLISIYTSAGLVINILITIVGPIAIYYLLNENYREVAYFFPLLSLAFIPRIFFTVYQFPAFYYKRTKIMPVINFTTIVVYFIAFILAAPSLGIYGVCIVAIIIKVTQMIFMYIYVEKNSLNIKGISFINVGFELGISLIVFIYLFVWYLFSNNITTIEKFLYLTPLFILIPFLLRRLLILSDLSVLKIFKKLRLKV